MSVVEILLATAVVPPYIPSVTEKLKGLLARYGRLALLTYMVIFALFYAGFYAAIVAGFRPEGVDGNVGAFGGAYLATKLTQPIRIAASLLLTPLVDAVIQRFRPSADRTVTEPAKSPNP